MMKLFLTNTSAILISVLLTTNISIAKEALSIADDSCESVPRATNTHLPLSSASDDWFRVYESHPSVYSITEPFQIQESISHLIVGTKRAILFDTGAGLLSIKAVVKRITDLPITVINSHTHYDHVGNNWEFSDVLAVDSIYTKANMAGFSHQRIADDLYPAAFCKGVPKEVNLNTFTTKPWQVSRLIKDGEIIDLGGRKIKVLLTAGHTPDAVTLLDAENRLLFTGDSWYDGRLWMFVKETSIDDYQKSIAQLSLLETQVDFLFGGHNSARISSGPIQKLHKVLKEIISGNRKGKIDDYNSLSFDVDGVKILISQQGLNGQQGDISKGGSGLETWSNNK
jgi:glyoxylase-like metal-dependent hydrolase (beta-lactamase superfamily II)